MSQQERELCMKLYKQYKERLKWYMWNWFSWLNEEDVHDILQDTWKELNEKISMVSEMDGVHQFNWLLTVCHNKTVSFLRKEGKFADMDDAQVSATLEARREITLEDEIIRKIMLEELLKELTDEERKILFLSMCGRPDKKAKQSNAITCKIYRIRQKLKNKWKKGGWDKQQEIE